MELKDFKEGLRTHTIEKQSERYLLWKITSEYGTVWFEVWLKKYDEKKEIIRPFNEAYGMWAWTHVTMKTVHEKNYVYQFDLIKG